ncbi:UPF0158 family protein [Paenibacillus sp. YYML68]|uniref:UPF0158 family protein n=1 Tax=Paenibacillus sp. YYML68 TaxID=2909250 RepID=UPI00249166DE|nr:UPF0158 family protein [Paenibacillus sp. YYML68]
MKRRRSHRAVEDNRNESIFEQDDYFYMIIGYTEGGAPYGVTWEEHEEQQRREQHAELRKDDRVWKELQLRADVLKELADTFDWRMDGFDFFFNIETQEVVSVRTYDRDEEDEELSELIEEGFGESYYRVPHTESWEGEADLTDFTETVADSKLRKRLSDTIYHRRQMFRRFKNALASYPAELERYYRFVEERNRGRVLEWLESLGYKVTVV